MEGDIADETDAIDVATTYADEECVGEPGDVLTVESEDSVWIVAFRTHTYADVYRHRIRLNRVGNVFAHERADSAD